MFSVKTSSFLAGEGKYCSNKCFGASIRGAAHYNYKHGKSNTHEYWRLWSHNKRDRTRQNGGEFTAEQIYRLFNRQKGKCYWCQNSIKRTYEIDHRKPVSRGGYNGISNIVLACRKCNAMKHAATPEEFARKMGLLVA